MKNESKRYNVIIEKSAARMALQHVRHLTEYSESAALRFQKEFIDRAKSLESMPERCSWVSDPNIDRQKYRKLLFERHYLLIFRVEAETSKVYIDAVVDCHQNYGWLLY